MHTLKNIAFGIVGAVIFALGVRIGFQAEQEATAAHNAAHP